jgi:lysophospholipase L1-like esterase
MLPFEQLALPPDNPPTIRWIMRCLNRSLLFPFLCTLSFLPVLAVAPVHAEQFTVATLGDSITSGVPYYTATNANGCVPPCGGYQPELQSLLRASGREAVVRNYGLRGDTSHDGVRRIDAVMEACKPKYILLLEGTNEIYFLSPVTVRSNLALMVDKAKARGVVPVIGTLTPDSQFTSKPIPATNALLKDLAVRRKVPLSDLYQATVARWRSISSQDGIHPNLTGYRIVAKTWFDTLVAWEESNAAPSASFLPTMYLLLLEN